MRRRSAPSRRGGLVGLAALVGALLSGAPAARATILVEVPLDEMIHDADAIVLGEVVHVGVRVQVEAGRVEPWTVTTVRVERWLSGTGGGRVVIEERGGEWQGGGMRIAGIPTYRAGERVVVFLQRDSMGRLRTFGMAQGKMRIRVALDGVPTSVERDFEDVSFARWEDGRMVVDHLDPPALQLDELLRRIDQVVSLRAPVMTPSGGALSR